MKFKATFKHWLTAPYQLVIRNEEDLAETDTWRFNHAKLLTLGTLVFMLLFALSLFLAHTVLAKWLNPAYIEQENTNKLLRLSTAVESLETQTSQQSKFIKMIQSIIAGKEEPHYPLEEEKVQLQADNTDLAEDLTHQVPSSEPIDAIDDALNSSFEAPENTLSQASYPKTKACTDIFFFTPIEGIITTPFNVKMEHYGIDIVAKENEPIKCVADGMVILSTWTVETGWVIAIQHSKNLVSIYKHNATLFKKTGDLVTAGEVIAIMGNSGELSTGPHLHFELWYEGNAVNPENFISF